MTSVSFVGLRTSNFEAMRELYAAGYRRPVLHESPGVVWFALAGRAELHLCADSDEYHSFFGGGSVVGLLVGDYQGVVRRLTDQGVELITELDTAGGRIWLHYRAADGNVHEVMGPA